MTYSKYYVVKPPQPKCPPTPHHVMMKIGIQGQNIENSVYARRRYGPGSELLAGYTFNMPLRDLEKKIEKPILEILKCRGRICEIVRGQKEHFWVRTSDIQRFVDLVKALVEEHTAA
jgi:hypothetical protein